MKHAALLGLLLSSMGGAVACDKQKENKSTTPPVAPSAEPVVARGEPAKLEKFEMPELRIKDDAETTVKVTWKLPPGTALNDEAAFKVRWNRSDGLADPPENAQTTGSAVKDGYTVKVKPLKGAANPTLSGEMHIVVCDALNHSVCLPVRRHVELGFVAAKDADREVKIEVPLPAAKP